MKKMLKVTRYKCAWCGEEFRTPDKHDCKFDPDKRNCLSCRHVCGTFLVRGDKLNGEGDTVFFQCRKHGKDECDLSNDISVLHADHWRGDCPQYELADGYAGKETYKRIFEAKGGDHG